MIDFLVFGSTGYLGSHNIKHLNKQEYTYAISSSRAENKKDIEYDLDIIKPKYVICAVGLTGTPNIGWFEDHKIEGIQTNVLGIMNIVDACYVRNIHITIYGSAYIYDTTKEIMYCENDEPNNDKSYYCELRIILEQLIKPYTNVLNLRINLPISDDQHPKSLLSKLLKYDKITSELQSVTVLDDLLPLISHMAEKGLVGTFNFVNPGTITNQRILELYNEYVNPEKTKLILNDISDSESKTNKQKNLKKNNGLNVNKLLSIFTHIPDIETSIIQLMKRIANKQ